MLKFFIGKLEGFITGVIIGLTALISGIFIGLCYAINIGDAELTWTNKNKED